MVALRKSLHVLVVDDDHGVIESVSCVVRGLGHEPIPALDRIEAIEVVRAVPVHFSILDVHVRSDDGIKILGSLRSFAARLPAIFMSGGLTPEIVARAGVLGVQRLLEKPLDIALLRRAIHDLIAVEKL